jgi:hypothetical protein
MGKKIQESKSVQKSTKKVHILSKSEACSADVSGHLLADFSSRRLQKLLHQRYKVSARIF